MGSKKSVAKAIEQRKTLRDKDDTQRRKELEQHKQDPGGQEAWVMFNFLRTKALLVALGA